MGLTKDAVVTINKQAQEQIQFWEQFTTALKERESINATANRLSRILACAIKLAGGTLTIPKDMWESVPEGWHSCSVSVGADAYFIRSDTPKKLAEDMSEI